MKKITVVFNSGVTQEFFVESLTVKKDGFGQFSGIEWTEIPGKKTPARINLDNVDGIFYEDLTVVDAMNEAKKMMA
ncbi:hypothetical protein [Brevibacillus porteri]|uniref:hypothetical protein n=1 Tax=Brevibacillus porteri TaxID=2126350 RepID=UPI00363FB1F0